LIASLLFIFIPPSKRICRENGLPCNNPYPVVFSVTKPKFQSNPLYPLFAGIKNSILDSLGFGKLALSAFGFSFFMDLLYAVLQTLAALEAKVGN
jgi:hypothetical protein